MSSPDGESIYSFLIARQDHTKKLMSEKFQFFDSYEDYFINYLTQIESESDNVLDMLCQKKNTISFLSIQSIFSANGKIFKLKLIRHTVIAADNYALTVILEKDDSILLNVCWKEAFNQKMMNSYF